MICVPEGLQAPERRVEKELTRPAHVQTKNKEQVPDLGVRESGREVEPKVLKWRRKSCGRREEREQDSNVQRWHGPAAARCQGRRLFRVLARRSTSRAVNTSVARLDRAARVSWTKVIRGRRGSRLVGPSAECSWSAVSVSTVSLYRSRGQNGVGRLARAQTPSNSSDARHQNNPRVPLGSLLSPSCKTRASCSEPGAN